MVLKDIKQIRSITKDIYKDLDALVSEGKGKIPIFGYPLICFSPNQSQ
jgi:hypothetical protein